VRESGSLAFSIAPKASLHGELLMISQGALFEIQCNAIKCVLFLFFRKSNTTLKSKNNYNHITKDNYIRSV